MLIGQPSKLGVGCLDGCSIDGTDIMGGETVSVLGKGTMGARLESRTKVGYPLTAYDFSGDPVTVKVVVPKPDTPVAGNVSAWAATSAPNFLRLFNVEKFETPKAVDLGDAEPVDVGKTGLLVVLTREPN